MHQGAKGKDPKLGPAGELPEPVLPEVIVQGDSPSFRLEREIGGRFPELEALWLWYFSLI